MPDSIHRKPNSGKFFPIFTHLDSICPILVHFDPFQFNFQPHRSNFEPSWFHITHFDKFWIHSGSILTQFGQFFWPTPIHFGSISTGPILVQFGSIMTHLGQFWIHSDLIFTHFGPVFTGSGPILTYLRLILTHFGQFSMVV